MEKSRPCVLEEEGEEEEEEDGSAMQAIPS
jgi:hypothetical protein